MTFSLKLNAVILFFFSQDTLANDDVSSVCLVAKELAVQETESYFDLMSPRCNLGLKMSNTFLFHTTLWLMMLHHYIKYSNKMSCGSDGIIQINNETFTDILNAVIKFFHRALQLMMPYSATVKHSLVANEAVVYKIQ